MDQWDYISHLGMRKFHDGQYALISEAKLEVTETRINTIRACMDVVDQAIWSRIEDLKACNKDDECDEWAKACEVALDDALIALARMLPMDEITPPPVAPTSWARVKS
jgi:hypothetical protein